MLHCPETSGQKPAILAELKAVIHKTAAHIQVDQLCESPKIFTQFAVDCTSLNLPNEYRININDPVANEIFQITRKLINSIHVDRIRKLKIIEKRNK